MCPEVTKFNQWLRCQYPQSTTAGHYGPSQLGLDDVRLFFTWANIPCPQHHQTGAGFHTVNSSTCSKWLSVVAMCKIP